MEARLRDAQRLARVISEELEPRVPAITPAQDRPLVPSGVGPSAVALLLSNTQRVADARAGSPRGLRVTC